MRYVCQLHESEEKEEVYFEVFLRILFNIFNKFLLEQSPVVASLTGRNFTGKPLLLLPLPHVGGRVVGWGGGVSSTISKSLKMLTFECNYRICPNLNISWKLPNYGVIKPVLQKKRVTCEDCGQSLRDKYVLKKHVSTFHLICIS